MAETGQLENGSESGSKPQNQSQQSSGPQSNCSQPPHSEKTEDSPEELSVVSPPPPPSLKAPQQQGEEGGNDSSEPNSPPPNSPPPDDSFSSGGEQPPEEGGIYLPHGGQLPYWMLSSDGLVSPANAEVMLAPSNTPPAWSNSAPTSAVFDDLDPEFLGEGMMLLDHQGYLPGAGMMLPMVPVQSKGLPSDGQPGSDPNSPPPLQGEELKKLLLQQLEYYFSKDNLSSDKYLLSQMDGDHYVPISVIANFNQVKRLSSDLSLIMEVIKESSQLQVDENDEKVRAIPEKRCVLILREIPKNTPKEDITKLFSSPKCPTYVTCEFADNDCWYVTFDSEESTQKAFSYLREDVREFLGHPIRARIKGTTVQRPSGMPKNKRFTYPMQGVYNGGPPQQVPFYQQPNVMPGWPPYYDPNYTPYMNGFPQQGYNGPPNRFSSSGPHQIGGGGRGRPPGGNGRPPPHRGHSPSAPNSNMENSSMVGGVRGARGDHYAPPGGRYRRENNEEQKKIPRLNRSRHRPTDQPPPPPPPPPSSSSSSSSQSSHTPQQTQEKTQPLPRQQTRSQQKLDLAPANFPPLPTSSDNGTTPPTPLPAPNHIEDGVSNLADIVKGKRLREGGPVSAGNGSSLSDKPPKGPSQAVAKSQPPSQTSQQPKAQRPDSRIPTRENKSTNSTKGSSRPSDRDIPPSKQNNFRNSQVPRTEGKSAPPVRDRGRHKDRDKRPGPGTRPQQPRTSPKPPKKQLPQQPPQAPPPPPTPTTPTLSHSDKNPAKQENGTAKSERLSYAQMAQRKAQPPSPPPPPSPRTIPTSGNPSPSNPTPTPPHPPPLPSHQSKQTAPTSPQTKTGTQGQSSSSSQNSSVSQNNILTTPAAAAVNSSQPCTGSEGNSEQNSS